MRPAAAAAEQSGIGRDCQQRAGCVRCRTHRRERDPGPAKRGMGGL